MVGICLVVVLIALDSTVVGTALPRIVAELQGYALYPWTASAYLMTSAVLIPICGRLGDLYGRKPFVLVAIVLFTLASIVCGLAQSMLQLVVARGFQGLGGGMLIGVAFASVADLFPQRLQRVRWAALLSGSFGVATAVGPALGGWLTEHAGWRSVFYVNVPVALLAFGMVWRFLPHVVHHEDEDTRIDWLGAVLLGGAVGTLLLATEQGQSAGLANLGFVGLSATALAAGAAFFAHQLRSAAPVIPARLFANPTVRQLAALGMLTGLSMFVLVFYSPLLLQGGYGMSPRQAGLTVTPLLVCLTLGSIVNGRLLSRLRRPERLIAWGQLLLCVACVLLVALPDAAAAPLLMAVFGLCGLSLGFQLPNLTLQVQAAVERRDIGIASALIQTCRMLGSMVGTSAAGLLVSLAYSREIARDIAARPALPARFGELIGSPQVLLREQDRLSLQAIAQAHRVDLAPLLEHARQGLVAGIHHAFLACALIALASLLISLRLPHYAVTPSMEDVDPIVD